MPVVSVSVDAFLVAAVIVLVSTAFIMRRQPDLLTLHNALTLVVVFHTLSIFYTIFLHWPSNIFQRLKIPLTTPSDTIRAVLLQSAGLPSDASLPKPLETLLTRLSSFDMRTLYVRSLLPCLRVRRMLISRVRVDSARRSSRTANIARRLTNTSSSLRRA